MRGMTFQAAPVKKPLGAVSRIAQKGNIVQFGPKAEDCFIMNVNTGEKMFMELEKGTYVINVDFVVNEDGEMNQGAGFMRPE